MTPAAIADLQRIEVMARDRRADSSGPPPCRTAEAIRRHNDALKDDR